MHADFANRTANCNGVTIRQDKFPAKPTLNQRRTLHKWVIAAASTLCGWEAYSALHFWKQCAPPSSAFRGEGL